MKKCILLITVFLMTGSLIAQEVNLSDSIIYIDKKPVALYKKALSESTLRYSMEVFNFKYRTLIKATVMKFDAPVSELKPFFYYELTFPSIRDTFSIYLEDEAFPLVLSKIIRDYQLIQDNELNRSRYRNFKMSYPGGPALRAQIRSVVDYLNDTRDFKAQVIRDRTKPVSIVNDRVIMQDGVKIGILSRGSVSISEPNPSFINSSNQAQEAFQVHLPNQMIIDLAKVGGGANNVAFDQHKYEYGETLYKRSLPLKKGYGPYDEYILRRLCYLIENYAL